MKSSLQVVSTHCRSSSRPCLSFTLPTARYVFNVGEGTQRIFHDQTIRMSRMRALFMTKLTDDTLGGLPGLLITLADKNCPVIELMGPTGLIHYIAAGKDFIKRPTMKVKITEMTKEDEVVYKDENICVRVARLLATEGVKRRIDSTEKARKKKIINQMFASDSIELDDDEVSEGVETRGEIVCYICQGPDTPGKFDNAKATLLGVPKGPERSMLVKGLTVTCIIDSIPVVFNPEDMVGPPKSGEVFMIVDVPSTAYLPAFLSNSTLQASRDSTIPPCIIVHLCGLDILEDPRYIAWIKASSSKTKHLFLGKGLHDHEEVFGLSTEFVTRLREIEPEIYPDLSRQVKVVELPKSLEGGNYVIGKPLMMFEMEPRPRFLPPKAERRLVYTPSESEIAAIPKIQKKLNCIRENTHYDDEFVVPLGTGSAIPSRYRNVSSTFFHHRSGSILFDCGEGSIGQLERVFGAELEKFLISMQILFISHMHGDHQLGSFAVIRAWMKFVNPGASGRKLFVVAPTPFLTWMTNYSRVEDIGLEHIIFIDCTESAADSSGLESFSGDCRPSDAFARAGFGSDLLIHEATLQDCMLQDAIMKKHCTFDEALGIADKMKAKHVLLTHFSQRFSKFHYVPIQRSMSCMVGVASDLMRVSMKYFEKLGILNSPTLKNYFGNEEEEDLEAIETVEEKIVQ